jgi:hypothetical protein
LKNSSKLQLFPASQARVILQPKSYWLTLYKFASLAEPGQGHFVVLPNQISPKSLPGAVSARQPGQILQLLPQGKSVGYAGHEAAVRRHGLKGCRRFGRGHFRESQSLERIEPKADTGFASGKAKIQTASAR